MVAFGMCGKFTTEPENREALVEILARAAAMMESFAACKQYIVFKDADDDGVVWVTELWDSKEDHDASLTGDDVRALIGEAMPLLKGSPVGYTLIPVAGKGL